jgi:hypothetical protein
MVDLILTGSCASPSGEPRGWQRGERARERSRRQAKAETWTAWNSWPSPFFGSPSFFPKPQTANSVAAVHPLHLPRISAVRRWDEGQGTRRDTGALGLYGVAVAAEGLVEGGGRGGGR